MDEERETIGKAADALRETAITGGKAIDAGSGLAGFLFRVMGEPVELLAGTFITDPLKEYRKQRLHRFQQKTEAILSAGGVQETRQVPPKVAVALFEEASLEDDDDLHTLWAKLLATAMTEGEAQVERKYVSILADLTRADAELLNEIFRGSIRRSSLPPEEAALSFGSESGSGPDYSPVSLASLSRLELIAFVGSILRSNDRYPVPFWWRGSLYDVNLTPLGEAFCQAVGMKGDADA